MIEGPREPSTEWPSWLIRVSEIPLHIILPSVLEGVISFSIKAQISPEKVHSVSSQQQPAVAYWPSSAPGPGGDAEDVTRKARASAPLCPGAGLFSSTANIE